MNSNPPPSDGPSPGVVSGAESDPRAGKATAKVLPFPPRAPRRDWQQGLPGSVDTHLAETLASALGEDQAKGNVSALAIVRISEFLVFVEGFGRQTGQRLSQLFQRRLRGRLRDGDLLESLGEDEFAVLLRGVGRSGNIAAVLNRLMDGATGLYRLEGLRFHVSAGAGVALCPTDATAPEDLLRYARVALRQANPFGQPAFQFFLPEILEQAQNRMSVAAEVRQALVNDRLILHYQPQYDLASRRIVAAEALLRFEDESGRLVPPSRFVSIIEESGLIVTIGHWVIQEACQQLSRWRDAGHPIQRIAVNLAPRQLMDENLRTVIRDALFDAGLDYPDLEIEITERQMVEHLPLVTQTLDELTGLGVRVAVDDFGTGYSSLAYLAQLPLNLLKIDRAFLRHCDHDGKTARVVAAIVAVARELGLEVIAEGIEQPEQEPCLQALGCRLGQGFGFSRPVAAETFGNLLAQSSEF